MAKFSLLFVVLLGCLSFSLWAHDPGLSSVSLEIEGQSIDASLIFNQNDFNGLLSSGHGKSREALATTAIGLRMDGVKLDQSDLTVQNDNNKNVDIHATFARKAGTTLALSSDLLDVLPFGHRQILTIQDANGVTITQKILSAQQSSFALPLSSVGTLPNPPSVWHSFREFFTMGVAHIATGYDHILFLFGLLLVCPGFWATARIITCFTVAHSITLALSTLNIVQMPSSIVEPMVAASIVYVGIENIIRKGKVRWREILAFTFGLVHGLGFASALREVGVGVDGMSVIIPLVSFNLGVETGQLTIASLFLPLIWKLRERPLFLSRGIPACSCGVALLGAYWFLARTIFS
jgi:hydrogenase/urease accessory protein HupE